jgi:SAM-dependent methyltransferase
MMTTKLSEADALREQNRRSWNAVVAAHESHRPDAAAFLRAGGRSVFPEELALLGELRGRSLLHLMCNTGHESLSFAALGAEVAGVDISDEAVARARALSAASGIAAEFVRADVYAFLAAPPQFYDLIYCGYGAICWLPDLDLFARGVVAALAPRGRFALMEFHPASNMFDPAWRLAHSYPQGGAQLALDGVGDYVGAAGGGLSPGGHADGLAGFVNPEPCHLFRWGVGEVVSALARAGLRIEALREFPFVNGERPFERMESAGERRWRQPPDVPAIPLMYGLSARCA